MEKGETEKDLSVEWKDSATDVHNVVGAHNKDVENIEEVPESTKEEAALVEESESVAVYSAGAASWSCTYFKGADIGFTGSHYGLWTLEDIDGKCQLWNVLFYSYNLDPALGVARFSSITAMLMGLGLSTTMAQATQFHLVSWSIGLTIFALLLASIFTTSIFNIWLSFWLFTYIIFVLLVRALFVHPVVRRISARGTKYIGSVFILNGIFSALTLVVLKSVYCTCKSLSAGELEGRVTGDPCESACVLGTAGYLMIVASILWFGAGIVTFKIGVQPEALHEHPRKPEGMYDNYAKQSMTTLVKNFAADLSGSGKRKRARLASAKESSGCYGREDDGEGSEMSDSISRPWRNRPCCQRICCDYRVTERAMKEKIGFWLFRTMLALILIFYTFTIVLMIGARHENDQASRAPHTSYNFITDVVCAFDPNNVDDFKTFQTKNEAQAAGYTVAHCGACADCSNMPDIETYVLTRKTIARSAKKCGPTTFLGSYEDLVDCLQDRIDFSRDCTECWADNMKNTGKKCLFTCLTTLFTGFMSNNNVPGAGDQGWLNHCLQCDEKRSGPAFVACSGVARRRLGIQSEIERNPEEQCKLVDVDWLTYFN